MYPSDMQREQSRGEKAGPVRRRQPKPRRPEQRVKREPPAQKQQPLPEHHDTLAADGMQQEPLG